MKYLVVFALCATVAFAEIITDKTLFSKFAADCAKENNINPAELKNEEDPVFKDSCYLACVSKKVGLMKEDGTYDIEAMLVNAKTPKAREEGRKIISTVLKSCHVANDPCKTAVCVGSMIGL